MSFEIVITGAAGFIGRNMVAELNRRGHDDLMLVDRLGTDEKWKNLVGLQYEDLVDLEDFRAAVRDRALDDVKAVIHLGACSATTETDADYLLDNNYAYTRELAIWCLEQGIRFVYASSAATYGDGAQGYSDADAVTPTLSPLNMYGYSKHMFDLWALKHSLFDAIVGLKYFNVYGPYEDHKADMRSVVHKAYGQIVENGYVNLFKSYKPDYADGEQKRDFVFVGDAVDQTLWFVENPDVGGLFNCGTGQARTWVDLANATFAAMDRDADIRFIDMPETLREKYQYFTEADMDKVRAAGYDKAPTSLEDGIGTYVRDYLAIG